jgi:hypothetical protein
VALLQIDASRGSLSSGVRRDRPELGREPRNQVGEFSLPPTDCFQLFEQTGTLAVALVKKPEKSQPEAVLAIPRPGPGEGGDLGQAFFRRYLPRRHMTNQVGDRGVGTPVTGIVQRRPVPIARGHKLRDQALLAGPIRIDRRRRRRACGNRREEHRGRQGRSRKRVST